MANKKDNYNSTKEQVENKTKKKKKYNKIYPIASIIIMFAIVFSVKLIPTTSIDEKTGNNIKQNESTLEKVGSFNNLYNLLKNIKKDNYMTDDSLEKIADTAVNDENEKSDDYSKTNIQVEGVDEADIVKTDGKYIYYLTEGKLTITDAKKMKLISSVKIGASEYNPQEIFEKNNKIIIIGTTYKKIESEKENPDYQLENEEFTTAYIYNVENKEKPTLERTVEIEGYYLDSRMIGNDVYLLSNKYLYSYLYRNYNEEELDENDFKPKYKDSLINENEQCIEFDSIYYLPNIEEASYLNIAAFSLNGNESAKIESYLGAGNQIYASNTSLFVTKTKDDYNESLNEHNEKTEIYKFSLVDRGCVFAKSGEVPGTVLNQFSMDEKDGYFRIATTINSNWSTENQSNNFYVLDKNLEITGKIENIAKGEKIYSVRFMGNKAYVVTFEQTDPLFVLDLKDPTAPRIVGIIELPGYSSYLHPYDETHLIGIGQNTEVVNYGYGDEVTTKGMKMSMYDVAEPSEPNELFEVYIGEKGTYSEVLTNHKALLFSKDENIIAFPISITENNTDFQGAIIFDISLENGIEEIGRITHYNGETDKYNSSVERIICIEDTLYTISRNQIKAISIQTMKEIGSLELE